MNIQSHLNTPWPTTGALFHLRDLHGPEAFLNLLVTEIRRRALGVLPPSMRM